MAAYTVPNVLVTTEWVASHATDAGVRIVEVDVDTTAYDQGHVPGAAGWNWTTELCDTLVRDIVPKKLEELLGRPASTTRRPSSSTATTTTGSRRGRSGS